MMKLSKWVLCFGILPCTSAVAGQHYYEARSDAMGGAAVASSSIAAAALANPALVGLYANQFDGYQLLLPVVGLDGSDRDDMVDHLDDLDDSYDALDSAIDALDQEAIIKNRDDVVEQLQQLQGSSANISAGIGTVLTLPTKRVPMAIYLNSYLDAVGVADIEQSDIDTLSAIDAQNPAQLEDLTSAGIVVAGATTDLGITFSMPLSIVNMPVTVGVTPKLQRVDTYFYAVNANNFDASDFNDDQYRQDDTHFNMDLGVAMQPIQGVTVGLVTKNLLSKEVDSIEISGRSVTYQVEPLITAGIAYDWSDYTITTDIDLTDYQAFKQFDGTQYWRVGAEARATDWLALRMGYRHDFEDVTADIYSLGAGIKVGQSFSFDFTGMFGSDNAIGGVIQTSYHF